MQFQVKTCIQNFFVLFATYYRKKKIEVRDRGESIGVRSVRGGIVEKNKKYMYYKKQK